MNKLKKIAFCFFICLVTVGTLTWISTWKKIEVANAEFVTDSGPESINLPFSSDYIGSYWVKIELNNISKAAQEFRITPDDELLAIKLNGQAISLDNISMDDRRNYWAGFLYTFNELVPNKVNVLEFQLSNDSNPTGFHLQIMQRFTAAQLAALVVVILGFALFLTNYLKIARPQKIILVLSLIVSVIYLSKTDPRSRTFDVYEGGGHRDYIEYLIEHKAFPDPGKGWEYHQPPVYYLVAAIAKNTANIDKTAGDLWGQLLALFFWCIFLVASLACLNIAFRKQPWPLLIASFILCFWPSGIIHSIRIGNDLPLYAFYGLTFFYVLKWWRTRRSHFLFWASLWMGAAILTKSNALAIAATLGALFFVHLLVVARKPSHFVLHKSKLFRDTAIITCWFLFALSLNFGDNIYYYLIGHADDWLLSNVGTTINEGLRVENSLRNYLVFDLSTYLQNPFISTWEDRYGRQYFWNFVLRSSLTSEFRFGGNFAEIWGIINGVLLLAMLAGTLIYALQKQPLTSRIQFKIFAYKNLPWLLALIFPFMLLLAYRIKAPLSCNTDFRYIYPVIVCITYFTASTWRAPNRFPIPAFLVLGGVIIGLGTTPWVLLFS